MIWSTFGRRLVALPGIASVYSLLVAAGLVREKLTANRTYYVRTDGSDSNTGLANTAGGAFLTIQKAMDAVSALDCSIYAVIIQLGNGTYTAANSWAGHIGSGRVTVRGDTTTPSNVIISVTSGTCFILAAYTRLRVEGVKMQTTTSGYGIFVNPFASAEFGSVDFGAVANFHVTVLGGYAAAVADYTISGGGQGHWNPSIGGTVAFNSRTVTLTGTPAWSTGFIYGAAGLVQIFNVTFSGAATGNRYAIEGLGLINSFGAGTSSTYFPGDTNGTALTGAQQI